MFLRLRHTGAALFLLVLGCNIFNPSGEGKANENNADALISRAENYYRRALYIDAARDFSQAISLDSTRSLAYFGLAKANLRSTGINPLTLLGAISVGENEIPFMAEPQENKNMFYQSSRLVVQALDPLIHRDTMTALWEHAQIANEDENYLATLDEATRISVQNFINHPPANIAQYPLSDRLVKYSRFKLDFTLTMFARTMLGFLDINRDSIINNRDFNIRLSRDSTGAISMNLDELMESATTDTAVAQSLNESVEMLASGTGNVSQLISSMSASLGISQDSLNSQLGDQAGTNMEQQIADLGGQIRFYKLGDGMDNDGDGCVDEEIYDKMDNDSDGIIDEDLRLIPTTIPGTNTPNTARLDFKDNNGDGVVDAPNEELDENNILLFVQNFVPNFAGQPSSIDNELKLRVSQDTLGTAYNLTMRQDSIGGCWTFYNETRFQAIFRR